MTGRCHADTLEEESRLVAGFFHASGLEVLLRMTAAVAHRNRAIRTASVRGSISSLDV